MAGMSDAYLNDIGDAGAGLAAYIALIDDTDNVIGDRVNMDGEGTNPEWTGAGTGEDNPGTIRLSENITFPVDGGTTVKGWRAFSEAEAGIAYGGADFVQAETFTNAGEFVLLAAQTAIHHEVQAG